MAETIQAEMTVDLKGQVAVVTGASRGLGKAIAIGLARSGAKVACVARNVEALAATVGEITAAGGVAQAFACDVANTDSVNNTIDAVLAAWDKIHIMVNNAGITKDGLIPRMSDDQWDDVINTNLRGAFLFTRAVTRPMMQQRYGRIVNIASIAGKEGNPKMGPYSASKAAVIALTKSLSKELVGKGDICVNSISPAVIQTPILEQLNEEQIKMMLSKIPLGRTGKPEEVAALVHFLASRECSFTTGQCYDISGGRATY